MSIQDCTKIIICDLPQQIDEAWLLNFVGEVATPKSIKIEKERLQSPRMRAFLEFASHDDAQRVISALNYTKLDNVPIRISWFLKQHDRAANLFIKNLDPSIEVAQLHEAFSNFGEVISCKIPLVDGKSQGFGYVQFLKREDAETAMNDLKGAYIEGKPIEIGRYIPHLRQNKEMTFTNLYIKNLPDSIKTDEDLEELFLPYGDIQNVHLALDENLESLHYGFCNMLNHDDAVKAIDSLNGELLDGSDIPLVVTRMKKKEERRMELEIKTRLYRHQKYLETKDRNFYIRGFDKNLTKEELLEALQPFGEIESIDYKDKLDGSAIVLFKDNESADAFFKQSPTFKINGMPIYVAYFKPAERRKMETETL